MILKSDNSSYFISEEFKLFTNFNGIKHAFIAQYHHTAYTFKETIKMRVDGKETLETKVNGFFFSF